jgi:HPt (histidine-containing phosphotransfer) domain-containing protein
MSQPKFLSMAKAIQYVGDAASAAQLLTTLQSSLASEIQEIAQAIEAKNLETLKKIFHQIKGFAPVFCHDTLVDEIKATETLCKTIDNAKMQIVALNASSNLLVSLNGLLAEVNAHLSAPASTKTALTKPPSPEDPEPPEGCQTLAAPPDNAVSNN